MKVIEFEMKNGMMTTRVDGKLITGVALSVDTIQQAVKQKTISPYMKETILKNINQKLLDSGFHLTPAEMRKIVKRYEEIFQP